MLKDIVSEPALLRIVFKKKESGSSFTCYRPDGTATGQKSDGYFISHDLRHYVVETTLKLNNAFYGMILRGWDIQDYGTPWPKGPMPEDALPDLTLAEHLTGFLDRERISTHWTAEEVNYYLKMVFDEHGFNYYPISKETLATVRENFNALLKRWKALKVGESLEFTFP